jgi:energy-converting hydrogenase Eha subunit C
MYPTSTREASPIAVTAKSAFTTVGMVAAVGVVTTVLLQPLQRVLVLAMLQLGLARIAAQIVALASRQTSPL